MDYSLGNGAVFLSNFGLYYVSHRTSLFCRWSILLQQFLFIVTFKEPSRMKLTEKCLWGPNKKWVQGSEEVFLHVFPRATTGVDRVCTLWRPAGIPEKEPRFKRHLLQGPGYQTANKSDVTTTDEVCLANCWWHELPVFKLCMWHIIYSLLQPLFNITSSRHDFQVVKINYW